MGDGKSKIRPLSHFKGKKHFQEKKKSRKEKVAAVKCRDKLENKLSQKGKVAKEKRFQSQRLIPN